jgi:hypothetical protein
MVRTWPFFSRAIPASIPAQMTPSLSRQTHITFDFGSPFLLVHRL